MINIEINQLFIYCIIMFSVVGLCIGSFINVAALRGLSGENIVFPPSKCPKCGKNLKWYTNIPLISYIFLRGKCQFCKEHISLQYPIVEASNTIAYVLLFLTFGLTLKTLFLCALSSLFIIIAITDIKESVVIDAHTYIIIVLGLLYSILNLGDINWIQSLIGILVGFLFFEILARIGYLFTNSRAFGEGDTLIAMGIGAFFGWKMLLVIVFLSILLQAIFTIPIMIKKALLIKDYKTASALTIVIVSLVALEMYKKLGFYENTTLILSLLLTTALILFWCLRVILSDLKKKRETNNYFYLPFGPALVVAAWLMLFFHAPFLKHISSSLGF